MSDSITVKSTHITCIGCGQVYYSSHYCLVEEKIVKVRGITVMRRQRENKRQELLALRRIYARAYYQENREKLREYNRQWSRDNPAKRKLHSERRDRKRKEYWKD